MIVPVMVLLVLGLGLGFALLALVDVQTSEGREQRKDDAAQTLAEGVVAATANVMGADASATTWPTTGACRTYTHRLSDTSPATDLEARIVNEVHDRFAGSSSDLADVDERRSSWTVQLCPVQGSASATTPGSWDQAAESTWDASFLTRTVAAPVGSPNGPGQISMWVRAQANVRSPTTDAGAPPRRSRAVATKIMQDDTPFAPPRGYAMGSGSISTAISSNLSSTLMSNGSLTGELLDGPLGAKPLIGGEAPAHVGTRCGLLDARFAPVTDPVCLSGVLSGVGGTTKALSLGALNAVLGIDHQETLGTWTMASKDAIDAYRQDAIRSGIYKQTAPGHGNDRTRDVSGTAQDCLTSSELAAMDAAKVVFIDTVGDGEQYCRLPGGTAKIVIIARGAIRITAPFRGVVYALNQQECGADGECTDEERKTAENREVVRIEGTKDTVTVTGSVWADGAGGQVGVYPPRLVDDIDTRALTGVGDPTQGICGVPAVGPVLTALGTTLGKILSGVGNLLGAVAGQQEQVRYIDAQGRELAKSPTECEFLKMHLEKLQDDVLMDTYASGGTQGGVLTQQRSRYCLLLVCQEWGPWTTRDTVTFDLPPLLTAENLASVVRDVVSLLTATLRNYQGISYNAAVTAAASTAITQGAGPVPGSFRSVATSGGF